MGVYDAEAVVNIEQAEAWDGHEGDVWTDHADRYERAARRYSERFLAAGLVRAGDDVLDIGCGTGKTTREVARLVGDGSVLGVDLSTRMLDLARRRADEEHLDNVTFVRGDAQVFPFEPEAYDVAISSFGVMFFNDPVAAFVNIGRALRAGGRLAVMAWRSLDENEWLTALRGALAVGRDLPVPPPDAPTPFAFADPARVRRILDAAGYSAIELEPLDGVIDLGVDAADAVAFTNAMGIVEGLTHDLEDGDRARARANVADLMAASETPDGVLLGSAAWLITARTG